MDRSRKSSESLTLLDHFDHRSTEGPLRVVLPRDESISSWKRRQWISPQIVAVLFAISSASFEIFNVVFLLRRSMEEQGNFTVCLQITSRDPNLISLNSTSLYLFGFGTIRFALAVFISLLLKNVTTGSLGFWLPILCTSLKCIVYLLTHYNGWSSAVLFIANFIDGCGGSEFVIHDSLTKHMATTIPADTLRYHQNRLRVVTTVLTILTYIITGFWLSSTGSYQLLWCITILNLSSTLIAAAFLSMDTKSELSLDSISIPSSRFKEYLAVFKVFEPEYENPRTRTSLLMLFGCFCLDNLIYLGRTDFDIVYVIAPPFCFNPWTLGFFCSLRTASASLIGVLQSVLSKRRKWLSSTALLGTIFSFISCITLGATVSTVVVLTVVTLGGTTPVVSSLTGVMMDNIIPLDSDKENLGNSLMVVSRIAHVFSVVVNGAVFTCSLAMIQGLYLYVGAVITLFNIVFLGTTKYYEIKTEETHGMTSRAAEEATRYRSNECVWGDL
ncbi:hypothetical protein CAPTEDRAFT_219687 [Capitella teleta]|uniref:Major facilitator superfamily (MFS) profile domain-containing protein n=1 Tax=Capitella teleta TaxID=283909 RepID=R7U4R9_CAPTE|nr:hypothetical protein CAPTEDRAFT_219687 [Capitella teleta]|eukprot:ELU01111.1 hypothetical protein CAPTEDRAFT_219687 [Capitella teleta]